MNNGFLQIAILRKANIIISPQAILVKLRDLRQRIVFAVLVIACVCLHYAEHITSEHPTGRRPAVYLNDISSKIYVEDSNLTLTLVCNYFFNPVRMK